MLLDVAAQIFVGLLIELISLVVSYKFKSEPRAAISFFLLGTFIAGLVTFSSKIFLVPEVIAGTNTMTYVYIPLTDTPVGIVTTQKPPTSKSENWSGNLTVRVPTINEIRADIPVSLWVAALVEVRDMHIPGVDNYSAEVQLEQEYLLPVYWCASTSVLLAQSVEYIETVFFVDEELIPGKYIFNYNYDTNTGWKCNYRAVVLGGWVKNVQYVLEIRRTFLKELFDGQAYYPPGEYTYRLTITIR